MLDNESLHIELTQRYKSGANWFYWIAGLTVVTSIISLFGGGWRFFLSLEMTQLIDSLANALAAELGNATKVIALVLDIFATAIFAGFGWLAGKRHLWAYILGMVVFFFDGLVALAIFDWLGLVIHIVVLYWMFRGYQAGRELVSLEEIMAQPEPTYETAIPADPSPISGLRS